MPGNHQGTDFENHRPVERIDSCYCLLRVRYNFRHLRHRIELRDRIAQVMQCLVQGCCWQTQGFSGTGNRA